MRLVEREWETIEAVEAPVCPSATFPKPPSHQLGNLWARQIFGQACRCTDAADAAAAAAALRFIISLVRPAWDPIPGLKAAPLWFHPPPIQKA